MEGEVTAGRVQDFFERGCQQGIGSQWQLAWLLQRAKSFTALAEIRLFLIFLVSVPGTLHNVWQATSPTSCSCLIYRYITVHFCVYVVLGQSNLLPSLALLERWKQCGSSSTTILSKKKNNFNKRRPIPTLTSKVGWKVF